MASPFGRMMDKLWGKRRTDKSIPDYRQFQTPSEPAPMVSAWNRSMYEQSLVRACIDRIATACSKLEPVCFGNARPRVKRALETAPNQYQTWPQFLYLAATRYWNDNNLFIVPTYVDGTDIVNGWVSIRSISTEIVFYDDEPWIRLHTMSGETLAIELKYIVIMTRFQYESDFFGTPNNLDSTLNLLKAQEKAQMGAIKDTGAVKFIAAANGNMREEDIEKKRDRFSESNLNPDNNKSGLMVYDNTFLSVTQVDPKNWTIPSDEMERIENNVFDYFGMNRDILQNKFDENKWDAFYEGDVEPWAIQLGESLTQATFTMRQRPANRIEFSSDRLSYASASSKRNMNKDMLDRGVMTVNQALRVLQLPEIGPDGDVRILRGEYKVGHTIEEILRAQDAQYQATSAGESSEKDIDPADADVERPDSDGYGSGGDTDSGDVTTTEQDRWD